MKNKITALLYTILFTSILGGVITIITIYPLIGLPILITIAGVVFFVSVYNIILKYLNDN